MPSRKTSNHLKLELHLKEQPTEKMAEHLRFCTYDVGPPVKGVALLTLCYDLGITTSHSRPRVSDDNPPHIGLLFRRTRNWARYPYGRFGTLDETRTTIVKFVAYYYNNHHHRIALNYVTTSQIHSGEHLEILTKRDELYEKMKEYNRGIRLETRQQPSLQRMGLGHHHQTLRHHKRS